MPWMKKGGFATFGAVAHKVVVDFWSHIIKLLGTTRARQPERTPTLGLKCKYVSYASSPGRFFPHLLRAEGARGCESSLYSSMVFPPNIGMNFYKRRVSPLKE